MEEFNTNAARNTSPLEALERLSCDASQSLKKYADGDDEARGLLAIVREARRLRDRILTHIDHHGGSADLYHDLAFLERACRYVPDAIEQEVYDRVAAA